MKNILQRIKLNVNHALNMNKNSKNIIFLSIANYYSPRGVKIGGFLKYNWKKCFHSSSSSLMHFNRLHAAPTLATSIGFK